MTPEAQRIAIAEACGWKINREPPYAGMAWRPGTPPHGMTVRTTFFGCLPDYLNDLNAMHEAEKVLTEDQLDDFADWLGFDMEEYPYKNARRLLRATAAQRAEAFLRTLGKWSDK